MGIFSSSFARVRSEGNSEQKSVTGGDLNHLERLESESIHIIREVAAEFKNPVLLYSVGKDSAVLLHLAMKAFAPGKLPFPLLHIDTQWKFRQMIEYRDDIAKRWGLDLRVHKIGRAHV